MMHIRTFAAMSMAVFVLFSSGCRTPHEPKEPDGAPFVRIEEIDGRSWFVHGDKRFVSMGVNVVDFADYSKPKDGRRYDVLSKYNGDIGAWAKATGDRLRSWNFTTVGGWSHEAACTNSGMYYTRVLSLGPWGRNDSRLIDVFSENYAAALDRTAAKEVAPHSGNKLLIGYFANNELPWYGERGWPTSPSVSLLSRYLRLPEQSPGRLRLLAFLRETYSDDFAALKEVWDVDADSFDELVKARKITPRRREATRDVTAWAGIVAEQYFKLCAETIKRHDPNHLFLGARFADRAYESVIAACGRYADAISINQYRRNGVFDHQRAGAIAALTGKPVMITEYSWRAMENSSGCPNSKGANVTVQTQEDRAERFRSFATSALAQPYIIGMDWFLLFDQPPSGRFDGEDSNYGLLDIHDRPYLPIVDAVTEINAQANRLHAESSIPMPDYDPTLLADYREITIRNAGKPLPAPVLFADARAEYEIWGDAGHGAGIEVKELQENRLQLAAKPSGWGAGITFSPNGDLPTNEDGSVDVSGASAIVVTLSAPDGVKFTLGLQESGHGAIDSQNYTGCRDADGEAYSHVDMIATSGIREYRFELVNLDRNQQYGNQRGGFVIDTDAVATIHIFIPGVQQEFDFEFESIRFE